MPTSIILLLVTALLGAGGGYALRRAWQARGKAPDRNRWSLIGWVAAIGSGVLGSVAVGVEQGIVAALIFFGVAGLVLAMANAKWRDVRPPKDDIALEPSLRGARIWRGAFRFLLAGPISGIAAIGIALAFTLKAPVGEVDKLIFGGSLVPLLWGAGMAWTLADDRILRAAAALLTAGLAGFAISVV